ncbi:hypothetical protein, partial [Campylobacter troglodytis]|uniref:hypothetical protein n=1 Tax=Campylobacter troglodytis TaxID=654363 RepID=UPI00163B72BA
GNKSVEVRGDLSEEIQGDLSEYVGGNISEVVGGSLDLNINKDINVSTRSNYSLSANSNIDLYSKDSIQIKSLKQGTVQAKNLLIDTEGQIYIQAKQKLTLIIKDTVIQSDEDGISLKLGSSEVKLKNDKIVLKGSVKVEK